jgi:glycosyltransferase involved in cell wall biosynthesis
MSRWSVGVVVPAHDEAATVSACLSSIQRSIGALPSASVRRAVVVLIADRCSDNTAQIARAAIGVRGVVLVARCSSVGDARRRGANIALQTLGEASSVWLASTDADTTVPHDWLARQLAHADDDVAAVAGTVLLTQAPSGLRRAFERRYRRGITATSHRHVHAANLGVRGDVYNAVGGWGDLATGEDHDLWGRVRATGSTTLSDPHLHVNTSARLTGRAPNGFANDLAIDDSTRTDTLRLVSPAGDGERRPVALSGSCPGHTSLG